MIVRGWLLVVVAGLAIGCMPTRVVVNGPGRKSEPEAPRPGRFGEYANITEPGQFIVKAAGSAQPAVVESASLWPARSEEPAAAAPRPDLAPLLAPAPSESQLVQAVRDYCDGRTDKALERINDLDPANQEIVLRLLPALVHATKADLSGRSPLDAAVLASQLEAAVDAAQRRSPLRIRKGCFAWRVTQFGVYDPVPDSHPFLPGGSGMLYIELQNVPSMPAELPAGGQGFVTKLACSMQLLDVEGKPVVPPRTFDHAEFTRSPVRDYFLKLEFDVPAEPGRYALVVEITDPAQRKARHQAELIVKRSAGQAD